MYIKRHTVGREYSIKHKVQGSNPETKGDQGT